jgi:hypothetical protein
MMNGRQFINLIICSLLLATTAGQQHDYEQDYGQDYGQDNLYHDYAMKQQEKEVGGG